VNAFGIIHRRQQQVMVRWLAIGDGARANRSKRPTALGIEDEAVPLGSVVAVVLAESFNHYARDESILNTAGDLVTAHQGPPGTQYHLLARCQGLPIELVGVGGRALVES
jgi:hypothetical protein